MLTTCLTTVCFFPITTFKKVGGKIIKNTSIAILKKALLVTNDEEKQKIILLNHDHPIFGGHIGRKRLYAKIRQNYTWPQMARDVAAHTKKCHHCQKNKIRTHR